MYVRLEGDRVAAVELRIYEPPRFFEAFLRGRAFSEVPDMTARICGICPSPTRSSSMRAIEDACGVAIDDGPLRDLRRLIYCGEWIESHALHVYVLHAPDFLGYPDVIAMARDHTRARRTRAAAQEGRQRGDDARRRAGRSTRSTCGSAASTASRPGPSCFRSSSRSSARGRRRWPRSAGPRRWTSPT